MFFDAGTPLPDAQIKDEEWKIRIGKVLGSLIQSLDRVLRGNVDFGNGTDPANIRGQWLSYTTNGVADTEDAVAHTLGEIPIGMLIMRRPQSGHLYESATAWTTSNVYLKCTAVSQAVVIFLLAPPLE